ncbi:Hypothetical_protein [Hexamita inflata]|uniref:Hypothetical_protein n=1 Tax=Hexamita inflata TaxID=28002 RepID=A0ABP1HEC8_9EUKA
MEWKQQTQSYRNCLFGPNWHESEANSLSSNVCEQCGQSHGQTVFIQKHWLQQTGFQRALEKISVVYLKYDVKIKFTIYLLYTSKSIKFKSGKILFVILSVITTLPRSQGDSLFSLIRGLPFSTPLQVKCIQKYLNAYSFLQRAPCKRVDLPPYKRKCDPLLSKVMQYLAYCQ